MLGSNMMPPISGTNVVILIFIIIIIILLVEYNEKVTNEEKGKKLYIEMVINENPIAIKATLNHDKKDFHLKRDKIENKIKQKLFITKFKEMKDFKEFKSTIFNICQKELEKNIEISKLDIFM